MGGVSTLLLALGSEPNQPLETLVLVVSAVMKLWEFVSVLLGQNLVEEVFGFALLLQVGLRSFLHQVLQVVGVLLHPGQQVVEDAGAALPKGRNTSGVARYYKQDSTF